MEYLNQNRPFEINSNIIEWDMHSAGISIIQEYQLLPQDKIDNLLKMKKDKMNIAVGLIGRDDPNFAKELDNKFNDVMNIFITENKLDIEWDILSIKRDAAFVINKNINIYTIGKFITFLPKNTYNHYIHLKPYEFYITNDKIDIKGLCGDKKRRNELIQLHKNGIINLLFEVIWITSTSNMNKKEINSLMSNIVTMYKNKELDYDYYREFNLQSQYRYRIYNNEIMMDYIDSEILDDVNIEYNYKNIILPLIKLIC